MPNQTVIAIINEKGGTAKTTTAVSLSAALGALGQTVLLVDLDGQAASSRWLGVEEDSRLAEAMGRGHGLEPIPDLLPGVSLVPASGKLDSVAHELRPTQGGQLRKLLNELTGFDYVIIDCPPSLGNRLIANGLLAATHALVPVETSILALDGLKILLTTLEDIREGFGHDIVLAGVLACRYDSRTRLSRLVLDELRRALPGRVFQTVIRENVRMRECPASGQSILTFAPDSPAAQDYLTLAKELLAQPQAWRLPSAAAARGEDEQYSVQNLRSNAAASMRESARHAAGRHEGETSPAQPQSDPSPATLETVPAVAAETDPIQEPAASRDMQITQGPLMAAEPLPVQEAETAVAAATPQPSPQALEGVPETIHGQPEPAAAAPEAVSAETENPEASSEGTASAKIAKDFDEWLGRLDEAERRLIDDAQQEPLNRGAQGERYAPPAAEHELPGAPVAEEVSPVAPVQQETPQPLEVAAQIEPAAPLDSPAETPVAQAAAPQPETEEKIEVPAITEAVDVEPSPPPQAPLQIVEPEAQPAGNEELTLAAQPAQKAQEQGDQFPALRAYLKQMEQEGRLPEAPHDHRSGPKKHIGLKGFFRKVVG